MVGAARRHVRGPIGSSLHGHENDAHRAVGPAGSRRRRGRGATRRRAICAASSGSRHCLRQPPLSPRHHAASGARARSSRVGRGASRAGRRSGGSAGAGCAGAADRLPPMGRTALREARDGTRARRDAHRPPWEVRSLGMARRARGSEVPRGRARFVASDRSTADRGSRSDDRAACNPACDRSDRVRRSPAGARAKRTLGRGVQPRRPPSLGEQGAPR
jgi:hypothetical protein